MFSSINIDKKCAEKIETALKNKKLSHAVILEGADEDTRLLAAKEIAKAILCTDENKPCGSCSSCIKADADSHPDIHILEKASDSSTIKVDEVRLLKKDASLLPNDTDRSVFIISEAQHMGIASQNALLKIFEDPASHINFILTCPSKSCFLETIISRGTSYALSAENVSGQTDESKETAFKTASDMLLCLCEKTEYDFLIYTSVFQKDKDAFAFCLEAISAIVRDALVLSQGSKYTYCEYVDTAKKLSMYFTAGKLIDIINTVQKFSELMKSSANYNLTLTRLCGCLFEIKTK